MGVSQFFSRDVFRETVNPPQRQRWAYAHPTLTDVSLVHVLTLACHPSQFDADNGWNRCQEAVGLYCQISNHLVRDFHPYWLNITYFWLVLSHSTDYRLSCWKVYLAMMPPCTLFYRSLKTVERTFFYFLWAMKSTLDFILLSRSFPVKCFPPMCNVGKWTRTEMSSWSSQCQKINWHAKTPNYFMFQPLLWGFFLSHWALGNHWFFFFFFSFSLFFFFFFFFFFLILLFF